jgi:hypothetical protein
MTPDSLSSFRAQQQGGLTIVMALVLVGVLGAATFSLSRNAIRELSMAGTIIQGNKAAAAADAGLDWVIIWGQGAVKLSDFTAASPGTKELYLLGSMKNTIASSTGYPAVTIASANDPAMRLDQGGTARTQQDFDIEYRFLGTLPAGRTGGGSSDNSGASGGTKVGGATGDYFWRFLATGHATPENAQTYQAQRELAATLPPF